MRTEEGEKKMTKRIEVARAPAPLEEYIKHFDPLFGKSNQREGFRQYLEGLLLPSERHKTLTGLVNTEPIVGAQVPRVVNALRTERIWPSNQGNCPQSWFCPRDAQRAASKKAIIGSKQAV